MLDEQCADVALLQETACRMCLRSALRLIVPKWTVTEVVVNEPDDVYVERKGQIGRACPGAGTGDTCQSKWNVGSSWSQGSVGVSSGATSAEAKNRHTRTNAPMATSIVE